MCSSPVRGAARGAPAGQGDDGERAAQRLPQEPGGAQPGRTSTRPGVPRALTAPATLGS